MGCGCGPGMTCDDMDDELPSEADLARFGHEASDVVHCPDCHEEMYDDSERCPSCGCYISTGGGGGAIGVGQSAAGTGSIMTVALISGAIIMMIIGGVVLQSL